MNSASSFNISGDESERYERFVAPVMRPFVEALVARAELAPGMSVLDVACGTGFVARRALESVGVSGRVVGLDLNPVMIAMARSTPAPGEIQWIEGSALDMPVPDAEFDAVLCQQGIQFMPDRSDALREMRRVARDGGIVATTFFTPLSGQPYFSAQLAQLKELLGVALLAHAFEVDRDQVRAEFLDAGLRDVSAEVISGQLIVEGSLEAFVWGQTLSLPAAPALLALGDPGRDQFVTGMLAVLEDYRTASGARIPIHSSLVSGRR
jgi:ubiquinone/menaquinone biosynthesis C-methylase UbiE